MNRSHAFRTFFHVHFFFPSLFTFHRDRFFACKKCERMERRQWQRHGTQSKGGVFIFALQLETFVAYSRSSLPEIDIGDTYVGVLERCFPMLLLLRDRSRFEKKCPEIHADVFPFLARCRDQSRRFRFDGSLYQMCT